MKKIYILFAILFFFVAIVLIIPNINNKDNKQYNIHKLSKAERLLYYTQYEFERTKDPATNSLPEGIKERVMNFASKLPSKESRYINKKIGEYSDGIFKWEIKGPTNIGGRINCVAVDFKNENVLLAGAASGGVWKSNNGGESWKKTSLPNAIQSVYCLAQDKRNNKNNIWYYGTGELLSTVERKISTTARMSYIGNGIYKSTDNGETWFSLPSTQPNNFNKLSDFFQGVWKIVPDVNSSTNDVIYVATTGGIMKSTNGGDSWSLILGDNKNLCFSSDIEMTKEGILYAALSRVSLNGNKPAFYGIFRSSNGGNNWENITPSGFPDSTKVVKLAIAPSNNKIMYVLTEQPYTGLDPYSFPNSITQLWKYNENAQSKWQNLTKSLFPPTQEIMNYATLGGYAMNILVKPDNENFVLLAGTSLYRSQNGFANNLRFDMIGGYYYEEGDFSYDFTSGYLHPDIHGLAFSPTNSNVLYVGSDGGVHKTKNIDGIVPSWVSLNNGLLTSQFYSIAIGQKYDIEYYLGGLQDNGSFYWNSGQVANDWIEVTGADGMNVALSNSREFFITSWYNGALIYTKNPIIYPGTSFQAWITPTDYTSADFNFYNNFILDPYDDNSIFLPAKNKILYNHYLSQINSDLASFRKHWETPAESFIFPKNESITSLKIYKNDAEQKYMLVGTNLGKLYVISNPNYPNKAERIEITGNNFPKGGWISSIEVNSSNGKEEYFVTFSNYNVLSIFYSNDKGKTWSSIGGNLEENIDGTGAGPSVRWIKYVPIDEKGILFVGTDVGCFSTKNIDGMKTEWLQEGKSEIGNVIVEMIDYYKTDTYFEVALATQGGGIYYTKIPLTSIIETPKETYSFEVYPNPIKTNTVITFNLKFSEKVNLELYDLNGKLIKSLFNKYFENGTHIEEIALDNLTSGNYLLSLKIKDKVITKKINIVK
ncbi:MAG: T9SS type A sorting domain-containing protein [Candidatus Kapaibacteriota bacterium]